MSTKEIQEVARPGGDALGDRMKVYEMAEAGRRATPLLPLLARLDGRCFSTFTRGLRRPYDERLSRCMRNLTSKLVEETSACCGYTQSDEITLAWYTTNLKTELFFGGRYQKMTSVLAGMAALEFEAQLRAELPEKAGRGAVFDCRAWTVPTTEEAANAFLWREQDAVKNSISSAAQSVFSHKQLFGKHTGEMQEMLFQKGINWNDYPAFFKRGTYLQRKSVSRPFTVEELAELPPLHNARKNPGLVVERHEVRELQLPPLAKVVNRVAVILLSEEPRLGAKEVPSNG
jgi:tRNA(His) 5'-end guanylyltransferase